MAANLALPGSAPAFGVAGLRVLLRGDPGAIAYSHELTAGVDAATYLIICIAFPLVALVLSGWGALTPGDNAARGPGGPRRGGGGPPGPGPGAGSAGWRPAGRPDRK